MCRIISDPTHPNLTNKFHIRILVHIFRHQLAYFSVSPDDGLYGPKHAVNWRIKFIGLCDGNASILCSYFYLVEDPLKTDVNVKLEMFIKEAVHGTVKIIKQLE
jgi:hypothetical protein